MTFAPATAQDEAAMRVERGAAAIGTNSGTWMVLAVSYVTVANTLRSIVLRGGKQKGGKGDAFKSP